MLYQFLRDMLDVLRLRFQAPEHYRYTPATATAVLLLIGLVNAAGMAPMFGNSSGAVVLALAVTLIKWVLLAQVMRVWLHYYGSPKMPLLGFVLVTEALVIPALLLFYLPELGIVGVIWQVWIFWVQAIGFMKFGGQPGWRVLLGYAVYLLAVMLAGMLLIGILGQTGLIDMQALMTQMNDMMQTPAR